MSDLESLTLEMVRRCNRQSPIIQDAVARRILHHGMTYLAADGSLAVKGNFVGALRAELSNHDLRTRITREQSERLEALRALPPSERKSADVGDLLSCGVVTPHMGMPGRLMIHDSALEVIE
jgi:hypothetical protein